MLTQKYFEGQNDFNAAFQQDPTLSKARYYASGNVFRVYTTSTFSFRGAAFVGTLTADDLTQAAQMFVGYNEYRMTPVDFKAFCKAHNVLEEMHYD